MTGERFPYGKAHHCLTDPDSGFPEGLGDVNTQGLGFGPQTKDGPVVHACATCGERYVWRESYGFVVWQPEADWAAVYDRLRAAPRSAGELAVYGGGES